MNKHHNCSSQARTHVARRSPLALALAAALGIVPLTASAATISVTSAADPGTATTCTLRQAIDSMNAGTLTAGCGNSGGAFGSDDSIVFATSTFPTDGSGVVTLSDGQLDISAANLSIDASANGHVSIDANQTSRVMRANAAVGGSLILKHLTLRNGLASASAITCNGIKSGGGICIPHADLTLVASSLSGNTAILNGGGIYSADGSITLIDSTLSNSHVNGPGGGIYAGSGDVTLIRSTLSDNFAGTEGGGIYARTGKVALVQSSVSGNWSDMSSGGGIFSNVGSISLTSSTLSGNFAHRLGGGIFSNVGNLSLTSSSVVGNTAVAGGGIYLFNTVLPVTLTQTTIAGNVVGVNGTATVGSGLAMHNGGRAAVTFNGTLMANTSGASNIFFNNNDGSVVTIAGSGNLVFGGGLVGNVAFANAPLSGDPKLAALADNGGLTPTVMLQAGSAAIDAIACAGLPSTDQRGARRPDPTSTSATPCDIGAVEANSVPLPDLIFANDFELILP